MLLALNFCASLKGESLFFSWLLGFVLVGWVASICGGFLGRITGTSLFVENYSLTTQLYQAVNPDSYSTSFERTPPKFILLSFPAQARIANGPSLLANQLLSRLVQSIHEWTSPVAKALKVAVRANTHIYYPNPLFSTLIPYSLIILLLATY